MNQIELPTTPVENTIGTRNTISAKELSHLSLRVSAGLPNNFGDFFSTPDYSPLIDNELIDGSYSPPAEQGMAHMEGIEGELPTSPMLGEEVLYLPEPLPEDLSSLPEELSHISDMNQASSQSGSPESEYEQEGGETSPGPDQVGRYFALDRPIAENQQRERIAICPPDRYPVLSIMQDLPAKPSLVVVDVVGWDGDEANVVQAHTALHTWTPGKDTMEVRPKTPLVLSNNMDRQCHTETGFFFHIKIFSMGPNGRSYELLDDLTTNLFRTVSHSKLCTSKRRKSPPKKRSGVPKRKARKARSRTQPHDSDDDFSDYEY